MTSTDDKQAAAAAAGKGSLSTALARIGRAEYPRALRTGVEVGDILAGRGSALDSAVAPPGGHADDVRNETGEGEGQRTGQRPRKSEGETVPVASVAELGALVRTSRRRLKLTQQRFADLAGVGRRFVSELEAGKPTLEADRVIRCCLAAGIDLYARPRVGA